MQLHFGRADRLLYGVYHPAAEPRRRRGVVILGPWGWEAIRAHRTLRTLASRLAREGTDVLRFDYSGSGDSYGRHEDATVEGWLDDAEMALEELLATAGLQRVSVVGLRLGGLLAARVAVQREREVDRLVLWEPPQTGQVFLRWMREAPAEEAAAFGVPPGFAAAIAGVDLAGLDGFQRATLVVSRDPHPPELPGARPVALLRPTYEPACWVEDRTHGAATVPTELIREISTWLGE